MCCQNVCSLNNKLGTLRSHAPELASYEVIGLTESWLGPHVADSELQLGFSDYVWFRRDRDGRGGDVACAVRANLSPVHRPDLQPDCEALAVQLGTVRPVIVVVVYRPPDRDADVDKLVGFLRRLRDLNVPFAIIGDFNLPEIQWSAECELRLVRRTARAITFLDALAECDVHQSVTSPTRGDNTLDLALTHGAAAVSEPADGIFDSDHRMVVTWFSVSCGRTPRVTRTRVYNYKQADFTGLRTVLRLLPWDCLRGCDLDGAVSMFYDLVLSAISDHVPIVELRTKYPAWFDRSVRDLLHEKEEAFRCKKADPSAENLARFSSARRDFKSLAAAKYREYILSLVRDFKDNPKRYWSFVKAITSSAQVSPVLECDGRQYRGDEERANCLNACFARKFSDPTVGALPAAPDLSAPGLDRFTVPRGRVAQLLRELSPHKACGPDGLSARILRECADELAVPLQIICEMSVACGSFPSFWRRANVVSLHKKGSKKIPDNYRPVSLLPICSKILEKVVFENLLPACLPAIPANQHGFLPGRSCVTNLSCFLDHCWSSISKGNVSRAILLTYLSVNARRVGCRLMYSHRTYRGLYTSGKEDK